MVDAQPSGFRFRSGRLCLDFIPTVGAAAKATPISAAGSLLPHAITVTSTEIDGARRLREALYRHF